MLKTELVFTEEFHVWKVKLSYLTIISGPNINLTNSTVHYYDISTVISPIFNISLAGNTIVYTPSKGTKQRKKYFIQNICKQKNPTLVGNNHLFIHFYPPTPRLCPPPTAKVRAQSVRNGHQSAYSRADTKINSTKNTSRVFHNCKIFF